MTRILVWLIVVFVIFSCETVVKVDIPQEPPKLVLNSFFNPDSSWSAQLGQSQFILDDSQFKFITGAQVSIWEGDQQLAVMLDLGDGFYHAPDLKPDPEKNYRITAMAQGFAPVEGTDRTPSKVSILSVRTDLTNDGYRFKVKFKDPGGHENFYSIALYVYVPQYNEATDSLEIIDSLLQSKYIYSEDPIIEDFDDYSTNRGLLFKDVTFDGKEYEASFILAGFCCSDPGYSSKLYSVVLNNVSESYYLYNITAKLQEYIEGDPFAEPVQIFNNIDEGYGIFAAYHFDQQLIEIDP